jgi:hypothetical protein
VKKKIVELVERDCVVREFADLYFIVRKTLLSASAKTAQELGAFGVVGIDERSAREIIDEEVWKILEQLAADMRLPPSAELGIEPEDGVEYRINNDISWLRKAVAEALRA